VWLLPCPELQLLALDWAGTGGPRTRLASPAAVLGPLADALAGGDLVAARRLVFAQLLVGNIDQAVTDRASKEYPYIISLRNEAVIRAVTREALAPRAAAEPQESTDGADSQDIVKGTRRGRGKGQKEKQQPHKRIIIAYGAAHMPDLAARLTSQLGLQPYQVDWRTAWSVDPPAVAQPARLPKFLRPGFALRTVAIPLLLLLSAADFNDVVKSIGEIGTVSPDEVALRVLTYVVTHVAVYYAFQKWALDWSLSGKYGYTSIDD